MYHDEFANEAERSEAAGQNFLPGLAMAVGGGLWLSLMISLQRPLLILLFLVGGLLPLITSCVSIGWYRLRQFVAGPTPLMESPPRTNSSTPHLSMASRSSLKGPHRSGLRKETIETGNR